MAEHTETPTFQLIERSDANGRLDQILGIGIHEPYWSDIECSNCADGYCGGHADVLACKECDDDWPCDVVANVAAELERMAAEIEAQPKELVDYSPQGKLFSSGKEFVCGRLRARARELRGEE